MDFLHSRWESGIYLPLEFYYRCCPGSNLFARILFQVHMITWDCLDWLEILTALCVLGLVGSVTLCGHMDYRPPGSSVHGDSPGKNTGVVCHAVLQGIFPTQVLTTWMTLSIFWEKAFEIPNSWFITTHVHTLEAGVGCTDMNGSTNVVKYKSEGSNNSIYKKL